MKQSFDLDRLRHLADRIVLSAAWGLVVLNGAVGLAMRDWAAPTLSALGFALVTHGAVRRARFTPFTRALPAVAVMASLSLVVNELAGQLIQVDMHMAYFAGLAVLVAYCDWRIIAAAAGFVAVHHLVLNVVLPDAIYPGGSNFGRFLVHAVILVLEASTLMWVAMMLERMFAALADEAAQTEAALAAAHASNAAVLEATRAADAQRAEHEAARQASEEERRRVITRVGEGLHQLAQGDLTTRVDGLAGEFENLQDDFNAAATALEAALLEVVTKAETIRFGTAEVSDAAGEVARQAGQQASGLEQTAASLRELTGVVSRNAEDAQEASTVAAAARADAQRSGEVVRSAVAAMSEIENSAREIGQIIGIIDEIAFQTNLLALNAGVEAARAGETGRGFAVVASEVRALAQRSADAARDIKRLISTSSQQVARGVNLVGETGTSLERIVGQVDHVARVVSDMAQSVRAQAAGLQQVHSTISEAVSVTAPNTAMVEQSTHLAAESHELADLATRFRLGGVAA